MSGTYCGFCHDRSIIICMLIWRNSIDSAPFADRLLRFLTIWCKSSYGWESEFLADTLDFPPMAMSILHIERSHYFALKNICIYVSSVRNKNVSLLLYLVRNQKHEPKVLQISYMMRYTGIYIFHGENLKKNRSCIHRRENYTRSPTIYTWFIWGKYYLSINMDWKNYNDQTYSCPRDSRLLALWWPNWGPPWNPSSITALWYREALASRMEPMEIL